MFDELTRVTEADVYKAGVLAARLIRRRDHVEFRYLRDYGREGPAVALTLDAATTPPSAQVRQILEDARAQNPELIADIETRSPSEPHRQLLLLAARRLAATGSPRQGRQARSTAAFASRRSRAFTVAGGSIATSAITCSRWLWIMSAIAPAPS